MRLTINIDCTPEEARAFLGMPDVAPLNAMVVDEMTRRAKDNLDTLADPERFVKQWIEMSGKGVEAFQGLVMAAMANSTGPTKK
ncbi:MAG: DUF6489 family protein [Parvularculaceae bacterium]